MTLFRTIVTSAVLVLLCTLLACVEVASSTLVPAVSSTEQAEPPVYWSLHSPAVTVDERGEPVLEAVIDNVQVRFWQAVELRRDSQGRMLKLHRDRFNQEIAKYVAGLSKDEQLLLAADVETLSETQQVQVRDIKSQLGQQLDGILQTIPTT
jgi:hypothetical protein